MKKICALFLMVMLVCSIASAIEMTSKVFYTYPVVNSTGSRLTTFVPTTSIYSSDRIIGYEVSNRLDNAGNREVYCEVWDSDGAAIEISDEVLGETESISGDSLCNWFPYPRNLEYGIAVIQGGYTVVTIYFER